MAQAILSASLTYSVGGTGVGKEARRARAIGPWNKFRRSVFNRIYCNLRKQRIANSIGLGQSTLYNTTQ
jgi:hypothetical protein